MEQKKTLWIIAAVGAFLLVVLGAAGIMYSPAKNPSPTIASVSPVDKGNVHTNSGWTNPPADTQAPLELPQDITAKTNDLVVLADNATVYEVGKTPASNETTIDLNSLKNEILSETQPQNINITVNVPETKTETKYVEPEVKAPVKPAASSSYKPVEKAPEPKTQTAKASSGKTNVTAKVVAKPAKAEVRKTQFWVQVAAYSNKKGAEGARSVLDENKIPADIFTFKDNKDKLFYRVRVGPYTTKSEAEYWRTRIIKIDEFSKAESYITSTTN
ncbi:MAG: SPOR domain-containing protein [Treponema sp.]|nr:SPOR domain-containing protein [Treponema sp.]